MAFFDKLKFWKKDPLGGESLNLEGLPPLPEEAREPEPELKMPSIDQPTPSGLGLERPGQAQEQFPAQQPSQDIIASKNMEVVSSKLDALQANLNSINQRLENIENKLKEKESPFARRMY